MGTLEYLGVPWVWHLMDDLPRLLCESAGRLVPGFAREFERHLSQGRFLASSQQLVDEIETAGVPLGPNVEVLPNWVEGSPLTRTRPYRDGGMLRIATAAGQIDRRIDKGVDLLIEAAALLKAQQPAGFRVDIYGHAVDPWFAERIQALDLTDCVTLCGPRSQSELRALYAGYDLFAFPTRTREPFGFAALEAAAACCVPVVSSVCGIAEWFMHGVHLLKAPRSAEGFARTIAAVRDGQIDLEPIGRRLAAVVAREFHLNVLGRRIEQALTEAAAAGPKPKRGTPEDAYRLALLAERLAQVLVQETFRASA
jgi:glycosyltransferase involved in cell wall biosynthesis